MGFCLCRNYSSNSTPDHCIEFPDLTDCPFPCLFFLLLRLLPPYPISLSSLATQQWQKLRRWGLSGLSVILFCCLQSPMSRKECRDLGSPLLPCLMGLPILNVLLIPSDWLLMSNENSWRWAAFSRTKWARGLQLPRKSSCWLLTRIHVYLMTDGRLGDSVT